MVPNVSDSDFVHPPLELTRKQIRLLTIHHEPKSLNVRCSLEVQDLVEDSYVALSYVWGTDEPSHEILVNRQTLKVRSNLFNFLQQRSKHAPLREKIWIDAICINQSDIRERNHQVRQMIDIYNSAKHVIIWLEPRDAVEAHLIEIIAKHQRKFVTFLHSLSITAKQNLEAGLGSLFTNPYWTRLWIVPEVLVAKDLRVSCYSGIIGSWQSFGSAVDSIVCTARTPDLQRDRDAFSKQNPLYHYVRQRRRGSELRAHKLPLFDLMKAYSANLCLDPRDKIFAVLPLTTMYHTLRADYAVDRVQLFMLMVQPSILYASVSGQEEVCDFVFILIWILDIFVPKHTPGVELPVRLLMPLLREDLEERLRTNQPEDFVDHVLSLVEAVDLRSITGQTMINVSCKIHDFWHFFSAGVQHRFQVSTAEDFLSFALGLSRYAPIGGYLSRTTSSDLLNTDRFWDNFLSVSAKQCPVVIDEFHIFIVRLTAKYNILGFDRSPLTASFETRITRLRGLLNIFINFCREALRTKWRQPRTALSQSIKLLVDRLGLNHTNCPRTELWRILIDTTSQIKNSNRWHNNVDTYIELVHNLHRGLGLDQISIPELEIHHHLFELLETVSDFLKNSNDTYARPDRMYDLISAIYTMLKIDQIKLTPSTSWSIFIDLCKWDRSLPRRLPQPASLSRLLYKGLHMENVIIDHTSKFLLLTDLIKGIKSFRLPGSESEHEFIYGLFLRARLDFLRLAFSHDQKNAVFSGSRRGQTHTADSVLIHRVFEFDTKPVSSIIHPPLFGANIYPQSLSSYLNTAILHGRYIRRSPQQLTDETYASSPCTHSKNPSSSEQRNWSQSAISSESHARGVWSEFLALLVKLSGSPDSSVWLADIIHLIYTFLKSHKEAEFTLHTYYYQFWRDFEQIIHHLLLYSAWNGKDLAQELYIAFLMCLPTTLRIAVEENCQSSSTIELLTSETGRSEFARIFKDVVKSTSDGMDKLGTDATHTVNIFTDTGSEEDFEYYEKTGSRRPNATPLGVSQQHAPKEELYLDSVTQMS